MWIELEEVPQNTKAFPIPCRAAATSPFSRRRAKIHLQPKVRLRRVHNAAVGGRHVQVQRRCGGLARDPVHAPAGRLQADLREQDEREQAEARPTLATYSIWG